MNLFLPFTVNLPIIIRCNIDERDIFLLINAANLTNDTKFSDIPWHFQHSYCCG